MNGLLEARVLQPKTDDEAVGVVLLPAGEDNGLDELAQRCRKLLAKHTPDEECAPGHWLG